MIPTRICLVVFALLALVSCAQNYPKGESPTPGARPSNVTPKAAHKESSSAPDTGGDAAQARQALASVDGPATAKTGPSNELCYVCHLDFDGEDIVATHLAQKMGCAACHGPSDAHMSDEEHLTAPDVILKRSDVNAFCAKCHKKRDRCPQTNDAPRKTAAASPYGEITVEEKVCTDCHGNHELEE